MTDGCVMMLIEVSVGCGRAKADGIVGYAVDKTDILGLEGVMGWTDKPRAWYQASKSVSSSMAKNSNYTTIGGVQRVVRWTYSCSISRDSKSSPGHGK